MSVSELLEILTREYPNGVSFKPLVLRLLRKKIPFEDRQIEEVKTRMIQLENGRYYSFGMIIDNGDLQRFDNQALDWVIDHGFFSIERLFEFYEDLISLLKTTENQASFLRLRGFSVDNQMGIKGLCFLPQYDLNKEISEISGAISAFICDLGGIVQAACIESEYPHLSLNTLEDIRKAFLPDVFRQDIDGVSCWCDKNAIVLPDDFSEKLTNAVDTLIEIGENVTVPKLDFALSFVYKKRFREEYTLHNIDVFKRVCTENYRGENRIFHNSLSTSTDSGSTNRRKKRKNTRFDNIRIPIRSKLTFRKDVLITCVTYDNVNKVEYFGEILTISKLASRLCNGSSVNGFDLFMFEGETLWERRQRFEKNEAKEESHTVTSTRSSDLRRSEGTIVGLQGRILSPGTWKAFRRDGTNPRVADWAVRVSNGEKAAEIAEETGYCESTVELMVANYHRYLKVCSLNGISPESTSNV